MVYLKGSYLLIYLFILLHLFASCDEFDRHMDRKMRAVDKEKDGHDDHFKIGQQTTFILFGALGDLATRYLWHGFFNLYCKRYEAEGSRGFLKLYAAGRTDVEKGESKMSEILTDTHLCRSQNSSCSKSVLGFTSVATYQKSKSELDYKALANKIMSDLIATGRKENVRIIYLSVPPFAYPTILNMIHEHLRPDESHVSLRIIFEKPFGHDTNSFKHLQDLIAKNFTEEQIFRVDHYLGKQTVAEMVNFRKINAGKLSHLWNDKFIENIEVVMKEKIDCKGRTEFYDQYGVVLDVMQNHLTEILVRLVMELPSYENDESFVKAKLEALKKIPSPDEKHIIMGQYATYQEHLNEERLAKARNILTNQPNSSTPTFAAVKMTYNSQGFETMPFFFISGKQLNEKSGFIKINFKPFYHYKSEESEVYEGEKDKFYIKFYIHSSKHNGPAIEVSSGLAHLGLKCSSDWKEEITGKMHLFTPANQIPAYSYLIQKIDDGQKALFVDNKSLLESWRIWDPVQNLIKLEKIPLMKYGDNDYGALSFHYDNVKNALITEKGQQNFIFHENDFLVDRTFQFASIHGFLGGELVMGVLENVISNLVSVIVENIKKTEKQGLLYNIAFPGGNSIIPVYKKLCTLKRDLKVNHLHVWFVDERCVPRNHTKSNFRLLLDNLQSCLQIPYQNLHPMLVDHGMQLCKSEYATDYAEEIKAWIPSMQFDMVVLGLGQDGHIASLFQGDQESLKSSKAIVINDWGPKKDVQNRMSMTLKIINSSRTVSIIATGEKKREIVKRLKENSKDVEELPVMMVKSDKSVVWYIDSAAYE